MVTSLRESFFVPSSPDRVVGAMSSPALIEESERARDAQHVSVKDVERSASTHVYEVLTRVFARSVTGIDRTKTEENRTVVSWRLAEGRAHWVWHGPHGPKVRVSGSYQVVPEGNGSRLTLSADIDIALPVVGRMIEAKVKDGFQKNWPPYVELVKRYATRENV